MEVIGGHCASTAVFVNAHHSIGIRALLLFGTDEQKQRWLPDLVSGKKLAAFALTEPEAGSDAANVQTTATPSARRQDFVLNGAEALHHQRRHRRRADRDGPHARPRQRARRKVTAFLVTPDMPGFEVVEARMPKCGIRGTATARLAFHDMFVPAENILGPLGKGLRVALTVLDFGRTTFGASCTGAAKTCLAGRDRPRQAARAVQADRWASSSWSRRRSPTWPPTPSPWRRRPPQCAAFIDRGAEDYMLETAMLKVFSTDAPVDDRQRHACRSTAARATSPTSPTSA